MITVEHLSKRYGDVLAVDDLSFKIEDGHIYGFLGPNGAGKSTTLNIITGCLAATSGEIKIDGHDIYEEEKEAKKLIGYLPEIPPLYVDQTPREYLKFVAEAKGVKKADIETEIDRVLEETHITEMQNRLIKHLSKGYRQRVGISQALIGNPSVIILDEPTVGLDPMQIIEIRSLIAELGKKHTVILSSHILSEIQAICEKVLIIYKGRLVAFDDIESLGKTMASGNEIDIISSGNPDQTIEVLEKLSSVESYNQNQSADGFSSFRLTVKSGDVYETCKGIFMTFAANNIPLVKLNPIQTTLEDIFIELTSSEKEEGINEEIESIEEADENIMPEQEAR
ncbi:ABC transporter ATP-binding protein [Pseudobutyrivibrio xylanivorans]|uniref:ABC-2 type transport system ATP-binding protein n=1 Tax=Pseudobutyrivibrio xylanivorans TaxID=185007 RepID=A0A1G5RWB8_PSEXY|nr:ABC transporter ATP-binding protein [Pseudobutyrivibrio xylanivorans]SCZ78030.1 ABC-2 type transport system ATP-binding protein [Pseudobutyrivibrio xylanivorans]